MFEELPTPCIVVHAATVRKNIQTLAAYAKSHNLSVRPHTKTHKSTRIGQLQIDSGAVGLTVAKVGEAKIMADVTKDILMAYPAVDPQRCTQLAGLAYRATVRVAIDSQLAADHLAAAAQFAGVTIGILIDLDVGVHRTGVQSPADALALAQHVSKTKGLRLDGIMFYPGHAPMDAESQLPVLKAVDDLLSETLDLFRRAGLSASIVTGGSTPTAYQSHLIKNATEIRPGTYVFNDMNSVYGGFAKFEDCAARIIATVVSTAVPGQIVLDSGTKTLTSDRCGPAPDSGFGHVVEYPDLKIAKLTEEHAQVDIKNSAAAPKLGQRVTIIPNHICPCINLQDQFYWIEEGQKPRPTHVDARGQVF